VGSSFSIWVLQFQLLRKWPLATMKGGVVIAPDCKDRVAYPLVPGDVQLQDKFYMRRRLRPMVPAPSHTRMPHQESSAEGKARLYSLYLRPWVLRDADATHEVPHLANLGHTPGLRHGMKKPDPVRPYCISSFLQSWRWYIRLCGIYWKHVLAGGNR